MEHAEYKSIRSLVFRSLALLLLLSQVSFSQVLFEDDFDGHPDWNPDPPGCCGECYGSSCTTAPDGYIGYRVAASSYPDGPNNHKTLNIDTQNYRGASGKSLTFWSESDDSFWASDGILAIKLPDPAGYPEVYIRFYIKFDPNWQWSTDTSPMQKFFRVSHLIGQADNAFNMFDNHRPIMYADLAKWGGGTSDISYVAAYRYTKEYYPSDAQPPHDDGIFYFGNGSYGGGGTDFDDPGMMGDGEWHSWEFYVKINSAPGVPDGVHRFWQDGQLIGEHTDLAWNDAGSQRQLWNSVMIGGNNNNPFAPVSAQAEQWYAIDDLVISTEYIGPDYSIGTPRIEDASTDTLFPGKKNLEISGKNFGDSTDISDVALELANSETYDGATQRIPQQLVSIADTLVRFDANLNGLVGGSGLYYFYFINKKGLKNDDGFPIHVEAVITGVRNSNTLHARIYGLRQNYPNPFNPATRIAFSIPKESRATLLVYNTLGQIVRTLLDSVTLPPGEKIVDWDGRDDNQRPVPSGIYIYKLRAGSIRLSRKMLLLR